MSRLVLFLAGGWLAAGLATLVASAYTGDGALALLMPVAALAGIALAWRTLRIPFARHGRTWLTVACAVGAGAVVAYEVANPGQLGRVPLLLALVAVMGCGATAALERCREGERRVQPDAARDTNSADEETVDLDLILERELTREVDMAPPVQARPASPPRPARPADLQRPLAGLLAAASLLVAVPLAGLFWQQQRSTLDAAPAATAALSAAVEAALPEAEASAPGPASPAAMKVGLGGNGSTRGGTNALEGGELAGAPRMVDASRARRECLAQIESAHLFLNIARQASTPSAYARLTNPQIKQMIESRPIAPRTVQHIVLRMWERRNEPERGPQWWSDQYARCEATRLTGQRYVVRG